MKFCRDESGYWLIEGDAATDITALVTAQQPAPGDALARALPYLQSHIADLRAEAAQCKLSGLALLSPIVAPTKILAAPNNFREHTAEMHHVAAQGTGRFAGILEAGFFLKATSSLVGPSEGIAQRFLDRRTDHEVEFVIVIGKTIDRELAPEETLTHIAGYSLGLDITLRGVEERSLRKSIDTYTVLGPWLVTPDELPDIPSIAMRLSVNNELRQSITLDDLVVNVPDMLAYASRFYTLHPGDLIYTGSPAGVGPIRPGDLIHAEASGLGTMDVRVRAWVP
jgi:2,4-didehydro-3-deoxy-L-rhamnonate hydrolase